MKARLAQEAHGLLQRQKILDDISQEEVRKDLLQTKAENSSVKSSGLAIANAKAQAEAEEIEAQANVLSAELKIKAQQIEEYTDIELEKELNEEEIKF